MSMLTIHGTVASRAFRPLWVANEHRDRARARQMAELAQHDLREASRWTELASEVDAWVVAHAETEHEEGEPSTASPPED